jgi:ATP/maltotriose-dependent transcriptional regulator MalT
MHRYATVFLLLASLSIPTLARAGEADDLQRIIEDKRQTATDLERLDEQKVAGTDLAVLRMWLDNAWSLRSQEKYDEVRVVVDRCKAQADMIREKITAAKLAAQAAQKEADVARARATLERSKKALEDAKVQKIRLGGKA